MTGAFNHISHVRLLHNLRKRGISEKTVAWISSFLQNRTTRLTFDGYTSESLSTPTGIPQGSPLSPILYLFYNADLIEISNQPGIKIDSSKYIDDVGLLTYSQSTEENYSNLTKAHAECVKWARRHASKFDIKKYELMHLTRHPKRFNTLHKLELPQQVLEPKSSVRYLDIQLDSALKWGNHIKKIQEKTTRRIGALASLAAST